MTNSKEYVISIDLGGTNVRVGLISEVPGFNNLVIELLNKRQSEYNARNSSMETYIILVQDKSI